MGFIGMEIGRKESTLPIHDAYYNTVDLLQTLLLLQVSVSPLLEKFWTGAQISKIGGGLLQLSTCKAHLTPGEIGG
jgi:hypothetical protein